MPDRRGPLRQHHGAKAAGAKPEGALHSGRDFHDGAGGLSGFFGGAAKVDGGEGEGVVFGAVRERRRLVRVFLRHWFETPV